MNIQEKSASDRKKEHIELATRSQMSEWSNDKRFYYEPLLQAAQDAMYVIENILTDSQLDTRTKCGLTIRNYSGHLKESLYNWARSEGVDV